MLMSIGLFAFSLSTLAYDELVRRAQWKHPGTSRVGARDAYQFAGPGEETVTLSGTAYAELCDGRASLDQLRDLAESGDSWPLVDGTGRVWGAYVITGIDEREHAHFADGTPRSIDFGVDLLRVQ